MNYYEKIIQEKCNDTADNYEQRRELSNVIDSITSKLSSISREAVWTSKDLTPAISTLKSVLNTLSGIKVR